MEKYTQKEEQELNKRLKKWQARAKRLILSDYYDSAAERLGDLDFSILQKITNAESYKDINSYLWNSGMIERTLDRVAEKLKEARRESGKWRKK